MFGMGFTEIMLIAIVAILFLGPDKLPEAMVQIGKFFNSFRKTINEAKSTFEEELHISELREEALNYRKSLQQTADDISGFKNAVPNPAQELEEAIQVARSGMKGLDEETILHDELETQEPEPSPHANEVMAYKAMAQKALEASQTPEDLSPETQNPEIKPSETEPRPQGFKNLDDGKPA
ncbi:Sec-independent protein translocase protein TatB [Nitratifractor sp.]